MLIEYAASAWDPSTKQNINSTEIVQQLDFAQETTKSKSKLHQERQLLQGGTTNNFFKSFTQLGHYKIIRIDC